MTDTDTGLLLDAMLGTLATYLRMCGYDAAYVLDEGIEDDAAILDALATGDRTLLTRDRHLGARAPDAVVLTGRDVTDQLRELAAAGFELSLAEEPARCGACNASLVRVTGDRTPEYAPDPAATPVWRCRACGKHFWKGSHWEDVAETLAGLP